MQSALSGHPHPRSVSPLCMVKYKSHAKSGFIGFPRFSRILRRLPVAAGSDADNRGYPVWNQGWLLHEHPPRFRTGRDRIRSTAGHDPV